MPCSTRRGFGCGQARLRKFLVCHTVPNLTKIETGTLNSSPLSIRIGLGHDTHRLEPGGPLRLGGIDVPFEHQLVGHSDADVLLHAITDAILGAAAAGDIGELFPNTDEANRDRDSAVMLKLAYEKVRRSGYRLVNIDCIVFAQKPKLTPHKLAMRTRIAEILEVDASVVSVKAKTGEAVGPVGRGEAMMAECIALVEASDE